MKRLALVLLVLLAGCTGNGVKRLKARDGTEVAYEYHEGGWKGVILVHQLDGDMGDWEPLEGQLQEAGYSYVKLDLRGHGQSDGDWKFFDDQDFEDMVYDVEAAHRFLKVQGVEVFALVGASVGSSVAFQYALWKGEPGALVLLSPGFDYKGLDISGEIGNYTGGVAVFAGRDDSYSLRTGQVFERDANATLLQVDGHAHGADMLPGQNGRILSLLNKYK